MEDDDEDEEEEDGPSAPGPRPSKRSAPTADDGSTSSGSDALPDVDEDDESEYERTHRLVMEPEMLPSGRPALHHILAHRLIPPHWRLPSSSSSSSSSTSSSSASSASASSAAPSAPLPAPPMGSGASSGAAVSAVSAEEKDPLAGLDAANRVLVESSDLLMSHLGHHFFVTFKHMSFLHTAWLPLPALMEEGVKMKIKLSKYLRGEPLLLEGDEDEEEVREELIDSDFTCVDKVLAVREGRRRDDIAGVRRWWPQPQDTQHSVSGKAAVTTSLHHHHTHHSAPATSEARGGREYLCKWSSLPYSASTWERPSDFRDSLKIEQFERNISLPSPASLQTRRLHPTRPSPSAWKKIDEGIEYKGGNTLRPWQVEGVSWLLFNWSAHRAARSL